MRALIYSTWAFIVAVACLDVWFTWRFQDSVGEWEANPVARTVFRCEGVAATAVYRALWLAYAGLMARAKTRLGRLVTPVWGAGHVYLLIVLAQCYTHLAAACG
jgi:hypothetical protein